MLALKINFLLQFLLGAFKINLQKKNQVKAKNSHPIF